MHSVLNQRNAVQQSLHVHKPLCEDARSLTSPNSEARQVLPTRQSICIEPQVTLIWFI